MSSEAMMLLVLTKTPTRSLQLLETLVQLEQVEMIGSSQISTLFVALLITSGRLLKDS